MNARLLLIFCFIISLTAAAYSHGTKYEIVNSGKTGDVMSDADVLFFPPGATSVSSTVKTDKDGIFFFSPDKPGTWTFQVRDKSGHGMRVNLQIDESLSVKCGPRDGTGLNIIQKVLMALCVIWGAIGTALYFKLKRGQV